MISLSFYTDDSPYTRIHRRVPISKLHYNYAMVANDLRNDKERTDTSFFIAMCTVGNHAQPCLLTCIDTELMPAFKEVCHPEGTPTKFPNCFILPDNLIAVVLNHSITFFDMAMNTVKHMKPEEFDPSAQFIRCFN